MSEQKKVLLDFVKMLNAHNILYMIIGGQANAIWGQPRMTLDIDIIIWVEREKFSHTIQLFTKYYKTGITDPEIFLTKTHVLPLMSPEGIKIDVIFGILPFEQEAIQRAVEVTIDEYKVKYCSIEDLILLKIISNREKDISDVKEILKRQINRIDRSYLDPRIKELSILLDRPEICELYKNGFV